jgi:quinol monooxygenase YgiN
MTQPDSKSRQHLVKTGSIFGLTAAFSPATIHNAFVFSGRTTPREERTMAQTSPKVIMLIEAKIQPQRRAEVIEAARQYLPLVRSEPGVEAFYMTARQDDPNTLVFYEIYKSQASQEFHLQQDFTKKFLATLNSAQAADRVRTSLVDVAEQAQAPTN